MQYVSAGKAHGSVLVRIKNVPVNKSWLTLMNFVLHLRAVSDCELDSFRMKLQKLMCSRSTCGVHQLSVGIGFLGSDWSWSM